jgi:hypothetical protein
MHKEKTMAQLLVEKVHGGYKVDGLELLAANCGCGGLAGPGGAGVGECCLTFSRVKKEGNTIFYLGKMTTPNTTDNYVWGYEVRKRGTTVEVKMLDTRNPVAFRFGGITPPPLSAWQARGWEVVRSFEEPLAGTGEPLPEWCNSPESECRRPDSTMQPPPLG